MSFLDMLLENKRSPFHDEIMLLFKILADTAPAPEMMPSYEGAFIKMLLTLLALIVGIFFTVWLLKRLSKGAFSHSNGKSIQIIEKKALSPKTMLYIVNVNGQETLIAESQLEVKSLMALPEAPIEE